MYIQLTQKQIQRLKAAADRSINLFDTESAYGRSPESSLMREEAYELRLISHQLNVVQPGIDIKVID